MKKRIWNLRRIAVGPLLLMALFVVGQFIYQNCSNVRLNHPQVFIQSKLGGDFCSLPPRASGDNVNFIFVIDMSGSNLYKNQMIGQGTDVMGVRFDVIHSFLQESCLDTYTNKKFAVVGFSDEILNLDGGKGCNSTALSSDLTVVRDQIQNLKAIQKQVVDNNLPELSSLNPMGETYYKKAFDCVNDIIDDQLKLQPEDKRKGLTYFTFFLTDGEPTDANSLGLNININNVDDAIKSFNSFFQSSLDRFDNLTSKLAGGGRLQPVLYGADRLTEVKTRLAEGVLSEIANRGDSQVKSISQILDLKLCDLLKDGLKQPYTVKKFGVVNLTARMLRGVLTADSDMDGMVDDQEAALGFDPTKRRSLVSDNEIIDGLCFGVKATDCQIRRQCGVSNKLGLNACDLEAYGLSDGVDSDKDDIPDLVEILKGSVPNRNDTLSNNDGDELYLYEELAVGRDPNFNDQKIDKNLLLIYSNNKSPTPLSGCPENQESWVYQIDQIPVVPVLATHNKYAEDLRINFLNHAEGENIVLVYYVIKKLNDQNDSPAYLYGKFMSVNYVTKARHDITEFQQLGVINGEF